MDCKTSRSFMHEYLDGDLSDERQQELHNHLSVCATCYEHFRELDRTVTALQAIKPVTASPDFTDNLLLRLPIKEKKRSSTWGKWLRQHPFIVAASIFLILMSASFMTAIKEPTEFTMTTDQHNLDSIVIDPQTHSVLVPQGEIVEGDLIVRGGKVEVQGKVTGNVVAVDGEVVLASTADIYGKKEEIDQIFDRVWFEAERMFRKVLPAHGGADK